MRETIGLSDRADMAAARETVREMGTKIGLAREELRTVLTIVSELCLYAFETSRQSLIRFNEISRPGHSGICIMIRLRQGESGGAVRPTDSSALSLAGLKKLADEFEMSVRDGETAIHVIKWRSAPL